MDFLAGYRGGARQAIQVAADGGNPATRNRECRALVDAHASVPDAGFLLINLGEEETIQLVPAWNWLLYHQNIETFHH